MFGAVNLGSQSPRAWIESTDTRNDAIQVVELRCHRLGERVASQQSRATNLGKKQRKIHDVESCILGCRAALRRRHNSQRLEDRTFDVFPEWDFTSLFEVCRQHLVPRVGVDATYAGQANRCFTFERIPAGVRKEVAHRAAFLAKRIGERHGAFLGCNQHGPRRDHLRY